MDITPPFLPSFPITGTPPIRPAFPFPDFDSALGPLSDLPGTWVGTGLNVIWRPLFDDPEDHVLEVDRTTDTITFAEIDGEIPNRGMVQKNISMFGLTYLQQVSIAGTNKGLHIEPGIWAVAPSTTEPPEPPTVVRMASIPHGTVMLAQGTATQADGKPHFHVADIRPFIGDSFPSGFLESNLSNTEPAVASHRVFNGFTDDAPLTTELIGNPNLQLESDNDGIEFFHTITLRVQAGVSTVPSAGQLADGTFPDGGLSNTAFLGGGSGAPNAQAAEIDCTFWIETIGDTFGNPILQLQYSQRVILNFKAPSWPHISVGTLRKVLPPIPIPPLRIPEPILKRPGIVTVARDRDVSLGTT